MASRKSSKKPKNMAAHNKKVASRIKPASKLPKRYRALIYGRSGAQKTRVASTAPDVLVIDVNEQGTDSVRKDYDPNVFPVVYWNDLNDIFWYLESGDHPYKSVSVDGVTAMQTLCMKFVLGDEAARDASRDPDMPSRPIWGKVNELMKTQITNYRNLPMNVIFTALQRKQVSGDEDDGDDEEIFYSPACTPGIAGHLEAAVGMIGYLHTSQVYAPRKEAEKGKKSKKKRERISRTRLIIGPSDRYLTKDRYGLMVPHIDSPNITRILKQIYG